MRDRSQRQLEFGVPGLSSRQLDYLLDVLTRDLAELERRSPASHRRGIRSARTQLRATLLLQHFHGGDDARA